MYLAAMLALFWAGQVADEPITVKAYPWAPFISPMGEPFRANPSGEAPIARWFGQADRNGDGSIAPEELRADADRFFARLDDNHDGHIDPEEIMAYEWEIAPEIQVNSEWRRTKAQAAANPRQARSRGGERRRDDEHDGYRVDGLQGAARYALLNIPQPVASADADFNRLVTLSEFRLAAAYRFSLLDGAKSGRLTLAELEARLPTRPKGRRAKAAKDAKDSRVGLPLPEAD